MNNFMRVFSYEISRIIRRRSYLIVTFGLPFILAALSGVWQSLTPMPSVAQVQEIAQRFDGFKKAGYVDASGLFSVILTLFQGILILAGQDLGLHAFLHYPSIP